MTELLRFCESGVSLTEGELLALVGGASRVLAWALMSPQIARRTAVLGIVDLSRVPLPDRRFAYLGAEDGLHPRKSVAVNLATPSRPPAALISQALELVGLIGLDHQLAADLSRYDRQRAALARALAARPRLLVLDDPVAELSPPAQAQFRRLIQKTHQARPELTILLVTERREDALMLSDRIAVLEGETLAQIAPPRELYERPATPQVAAALGDINLLPGRITSFDGEVATVRLDAGGTEVEAMAPPDCGIGMQGQVAIRPERIAIAPITLLETADHTLRAKFLDQAFLGDSVLLRFALADGTTITVKRPSAAPLGPMPPGRPFALAWPPAVARMLVAGLSG